MGAGGGPSSTNGGGRMDPGVLGMAIQHSPALVMILRSDISRACLGSP